MTARQQSQLHQISAPRVPIPGALNQVHSGAPAVQLEVEQPQKIRNGEEPDGSFILPMCAVLFSTFMEAQWDYFGILPDSPVAFDIGLMHIAAAEPNAVYDVLRAPLRFSESSCWAARIEPILYGGYEAGKFESDKRTGL